MTYRYNNLQPVQVRLTEQIGWVVSRQDNAAGARHYLVAHKTAGGDYARRWYGEQELIALARDEQRAPPGISYIDPSGPVPGGDDPPPGGDEPGLQA